MKPTLIVDQNTPEGRVILALNHYISTGDHVGEGIAAQEGRDTIFIIAVNQTLAADKADWDALAARLEELQQAGFNVKVEDGGEAHPFAYKFVRLPSIELNHFSSLLREKPGPRGWGSMRAFLQEQGVIPKDKP